MLPPTLSEQLIRHSVAHALAEDVGAGDITSTAIIDSASESMATVYAEAFCIVAGVELARGVFQSLNSDMNFCPVASDGDKLAPGAVIFTLTGNSRAILAGERVALNFLQHLSGIATLTSKFCDLVRAYSVQIAATRKTTPGLRSLEKWAVTIGGGGAHRQNLGDGVLIKDNHLAICGGDVGLACRQAREYVDSGLQIEVEIDSLDQLQAALDGKADIVLLDNMTVADVEAAVKLAKGKTILEVSGGITLDNVLWYAAAGPDIVSIGALTQSAPASPMSLYLVPHVPKQAGA
ncbi:MAG: nicotinate-nucleotide diphosphorylase (carboxylating) [Nitrospiraceae bacterium]|nr:nicotinate-nucleotide diphosphorylase (carboxylating) [Nitrospiraceae bacterium]